MNDDYTIHCADCIPGMAEMLEPESVDLVVTSIPFASLFMYSGKQADIGNSPDAGLDFVGSQFGLHMRYVVEQLFRVMKPGCNVCIHTQQLITYKVQHGFMGRRDFRGAVVDLFTVEQCRCPDVQHVGRERCPNWRGAFEWIGEAVVPKNPQTIAHRQQLHSLQFMTGHSRDARNLAPAVNDHLLIFQRPGKSEHPVRALRHEQNPGGWVSTEEWIKWASGVWGDIRETDVLPTLDGTREDGDVRHECPLQLELIRRLVKLYSNPGDVVLDPFMGVGSVGYVALEQGRRAVGFELKESYHRTALRHCERALGQRAAATTHQRDLFDVLEEQAVTAAP